MGRKQYVSDFETTTDLDDCRVWAYGYMEIGNKSNYLIDNSMESFMEWCQKVEGEIYFHNLKFDGSFIVNWLMQHGFSYSDSGLPKTFNAIISNMGQWYMLDICYGYKGSKKIHTVIYDSLKKLPFSVNAIGKGFGLGSMKTEVEEEFYKRPRPVGHVITDEELGYIYNDLEVVADALQIQFAQGLTKMTSGSDSLAGYKSSIKTKNYRKWFPELSLNLDSELRLAYRGGFTWLNEKHAEKDLGEGIVFDVNSLYPSVMYNKELPYGVPIPYDGFYENDEDYPLYIQHVRCEFSVKDDRIPTIQIKNKEQKLYFGWNEYLKTSKGQVVDLYVTNVDLELILEHYDLYDVQYLKGWKFKSKVGMFKEFIDKWTYVKVTEEGAKKVLAKLMLNSLYGKFASNPNITGKIPYLKEDNSNGFRLEDETFKKPEYTPMGAFITSWARHICISSAQKCYDRIIYCDTDSIHLTGTEIPESLKDLIHPDKLGYWDHESTFQSARYIRQKTYCQNLYQKQNEKGKWVMANRETHTRIKFKVTCSGMPDRVKENVTWDNFKKGFTSGGKLTPKQVDGGVVLVDTNFTLK